MADKLKQNKQCDHVYVVTESTTHQNRFKAIEMRCSKCLNQVDLEKLKWSEADES